MGITIMHYRLLGSRTGLQVSELALGTGRLGTSAGGGVDRAAARKTLDVFAEAGGNFIDTSSAYLSGLAEEIVGEFLADAGRDRFVVSSKYGRTALALPARTEVGSHRKALIAEVEKSLKRLRTDCIDVYFPHFDDGVTPIEEIMRGLDDLARAGKILHIGLSNFPAWRIAEAVTLADLRGWTPVAALQLQYNLLERAIEREHLPLAKAHGLGLMAWSPLAGGRLTRKNAGTAIEPIVLVLEACAAELEVAAPSVALAWLLARNTIPVIGPRSPEQLVANLKGGSVRLDQSQMARLDSATALEFGYPYDLLQQQELKRRWSGMEPAS